MGKYAVILATSSEELGLAAHGFQTALDLHRHGHETRTYLCGPATRLPGKLDARRSHPMSELFSELRAEKVLAGACAFCATVFGGAESCADADVPLLGSVERHAPDAGELVADEFELVIIT